MAVERTNQKHYFLIVSLQLCSKVQIITPTPLHNPARRCPMLCECSCSTFAVPLFCVCVCVCVAQSCPQSNRHREQRSTQHTAKAREGGVGETLKQQLHTHCPKMDAQKHPKHSKLIRKKENAGRGQSLCRCIDIF